ncbi:MAG: glutamyl-tRNA synthetase [Chloroflexota bacterium]|jgi:glutamyl-tRNA synthetase|nr:glutamyl-tRNA synthetase [Chloroflexota bacterium]
MSEPRPVRVRIAPSPTGLPHIGTFRTFLFNWLFGRQRGGTFVIRIEDTDRERLVPGAIDALLDAVEWFGLDWDEGPRKDGPYAPYEQSERLPLYHRYVAQLIANGKAYRCYCSTERLEKLRSEQQARKEPPGYDRLCRDLTPAERATREAEGAPSVVRFAAPLDGSTTFHDVIHGAITWENRVLDDFVILKSDGFPTYHLAHLVDDHEMEISHVLRGDEWISSTPRHVLLYQAFGWEPPIFAHLPTILGPDRKKLSKRHGPTGIAAFQEAGYLPEALRNYLALCGWSPGTEQELFTLDELIEQFDLERVNQTGAIFDHAKLDWFNGMYIRALPPEELARRLRPFLGYASVTLPDADLTAIAALFQDRLRTLSEITELTDFLLTDDVHYDAAALVPKGVTSEQMIPALERSRELVASFDPFEAASLEAAFRTLSDELGLKAGQLFMSIRLAITGKTATPPLFDTMVVLGRQRTVDRLAAAVARLRSGTP